LADAAQLDGVVLGLAVGHVGIGRIRHAVPPVPALPLSLGELRVERLQLRLEAARLLDLGGAVRPPEPLLLRADLLLPRRRLAPAGIRGEQLVELVRAALAAQRGPEHVGVVACRAEVDHGRELRSASITCATPSSSTEGQTKSASASTRSCAFATATA